MQVLVMNLKNINKIQIDLLEIWNDETLTPEEKIKKGESLPLTKEEKREVFNHLEKALDDCERELERIVNYQTDLMNGFDNLPDDEKLKAADFLQREFGRTIKKASEAHYRTILNDEIKEAKKKYEKLQEFFSMIESGIESESKKTKE